LRALQQNTNIDIYIDEEEEVEKQQQQQHQRPNIKTKFVKRPRFRFALFALL
jgi:hypothetical protein